MSERLRIGEFVIEIATRRLLRGDGAPVHLPNRPFRVLLYLVRNRDRVVPRGELLAQFWDGRNVYDDALTRCVSTVRRALDDAGTCARYLETRWATGYRFVGPCAQVSDVASTAGQLRGARHRPLFAQARDARGAGRLLARGNARLDRSGHRNYRYALEMFRLAVQADPENARAHAGVAAAHALLCLHAEPSDEHRAAARTALAAALDLEAASADVQHARAHVAVMRADYAEANLAFSEAEALAPAQFRIWYYHARGHAEQGDHEGALARFLRAAQADPGDYQALALAEQSFQRLGLRADARLAARSCVRAAEDSLRRRPDDVRALSLVACVLTTLGRETEARGWTERAVALEPREPFVNFNAACVHIALRDYGRALHFLARVTRSAGNLSWIAHDPCVDPVRSHPRFAAILAA